MSVRRLTRDELLALPAVHTLPMLARAFGISEPVARERHRRGEWTELGIRVLRLGAQYRVVTEDVLRVLGIARDTNAAEPAPSGPADHTADEPLLQHEDTPADERTERSRQRSA